MINKQRTKVRISAGSAPKLAKEWFKEKIPQELLVRFNKKEILHAHAYGGLSRFFKGLTDGILLGTKCGCCGNPAEDIWLPPRVHCPDCWNEMEWVEVNSSGAEIYSHSVTNYPGEGFKGSVPCPLISLKIPGVCTKPMSYLSEFGEGEPYIGMPVKPVFRKRNPTYTILDVSWVPA